MGTTTFSGPVVSNNGFTGDITGAIKLPAYTVATAPSASAAGAGTMIYVTDGGEGQPVPAFSDGTNWRSVVTRLIINDS